MEAAWVVYNPETNQALAPRGMNYGVWTSRLHKAHAFPSAAIANQAVAVRLGKKVQDQVLVRPLVVLLEEHDGEETPDN